MRVELRAKTWARRWKEQPPFSDDAIFANRLGADALSEADWLLLLAGASPPTSADPPDWAREIEESVHTEFVLPVATGGPYGLPTHEEAFHAFLGLVEPIAHSYRSRLRDRLRVLSSEAAGLFAPVELEDALWRSIKSRLFALVFKTLTLELNVFRLGSDTRGDENDLYYEFLSMLRRPETFSGLMREYPVLARRLVTAIADWCAFSIESIERLVIDWTLIRSHFFPTAHPGHLVDIECGLSDPHRGGRSVVVFRFETKRVVYKPRSLAVDSHFWTLVRWLHDRGANPSLQAMSVLDRGTYGWVECVSQNRCNSAEEIARFFERQGSYIALFYILEATDFHRENIIADGEHPIPVDLEMLFHQRPGEESLDGVEYLACRVLARSVLRTMLLPYHTWNHMAESVDISGLGSTEGQLTPVGVPFWEGVGAALHIVSKRVPMPRSQNTASLPDGPVSAAGASAAILRGFSNMYRIVLRYRNELLAADGLIDSFSRDPVRVTLRSTHFYQRLIEESHHPDALRDGLCQAQLFDHLWLDTVALPHLKNVISSERIDLQRCDVPIFNTRPGLREIWDSRGEKVGRLSRESGLDLVRARLGSLSEDDLDRQRWLISASLATLPSTDSSRSRAPSLVGSGAKQFSRDGLIEEARRIGDAIIAKAIRENGCAQWIGFTSMGTGGWGITPLGLELYDGLPGVAIFLAYLGFLTDEQKFLDVAREAVRSIRALLDHLKDHLLSVGLFTGWGGLVYAWSHLGMVLRDFHMWDEAEEMVGAFAHLIDDDTSLDVIGGSAGCLVGLAALYSCAPSPRIRSAAVSCGDRLLTAARETSPGLGWMTSVEATQPLTGMAHGAAGIASALLDLSILSDDIRYRSAAEAALVYERNQFSREDGTWLDFRIDSQGACMSAWCHGAAGIGLSRLKMMRHSSDSMLRDEVRIAAHVTRNSMASESSDHTLCHGDFGRMEFLLHASRILADTQTTKPIAVDIEAARQDGWLCGTPQNVEVPGLMTGLAGIGYSLLRLADPSVVPSILGLEAPVTTLGLPSC